MTGELPEKVRDEVMTKIPLSCFGDPKDIAHAVLFLASSEARYITGQVLAVDGGMTM
jgi:3-oxoacyl-[acyl-carrier protein] reductase